ncbi:alpha/beta hydrolase [Natranaeroarchaeum sulfidigenes]|uniref:Putative esterase n=1 Tax=Natranaeroarchaeum sulfidigenes TaxID=2784880 RepID=A0A897MNI6_9EURY|nr:dienelactone hydrolase family protein [Natranaeroarchaeum sulfidigenes]QSG01921.1 putative esterase [Natranaeroarchaeum sulfidigenes]
MPETPALPLEHRTIAADGEGPHPAVVVLHGRGANETDLLPIAQRLPDELFVLSLRAPDPLQGGYTWYELDLSGGGLHQSQPHPEQFRRSLDLIEESIDAAIEEYDLDDDRVGLLGFSQGGITSLSLLLEAPTAYDWVAALHCYLPDSHADLTPDGIENVPVFIAGGSQDQIIPSGRTNAAATRLSELGAPVTSRTYNTGHGIGPDEHADLIEWVTEQV